MRTTLNLDDDVYHLAMQEAARRRVTIGKVVSEFARKGASAPAMFRESHGIVITNLPSHSRLVTSELVRKLENE